MTDCDCCCCHETPDRVELGSNRSARRATSVSLSNNTAAEALR